MLEIYNANEINEENRRIPMDVFTGDGENKIFQLYNITPNLLARVYLEDALQVADIDYFLYQYEENNFIEFYNIPGSSQKIYVQSDKCLEFPSHNYRRINVFYPSVTDHKFYIGANDNNYYYDIYVIPKTFIGIDETYFMKLALTKEGLDTAELGESLYIEELIPPFLQEIWIRFTFPANYITEPNLNLYKFGLILEYNWE